MKMYASLTLFSAALCICGQPHSAYFTTTTPAPVAQIDTRPEDSDGATGLGGLDGATILNPAAELVRNDMSPDDTTPEARMPDDTTPALGRRGAVLTRNDARRQPGD